MSIIVGKGGDLSVVVNRDPAARCFTCRWWAGAFTVDVGSEDEIPMFVGVGQCHLTPVASTAPPEGWCSDHDDSDRWKIGSTTDVEVVIEAIRKAGL